MLRVVPPGPPATAVVAPVSTGLAPGTGSGPPAPPRGPDSSRWRVRGRKIADRGPFHHRARGLAFPARRPTTAPPGRRPTQPRRAPGCPRRARPATAGFRGTLLPRSPGPGRLRLTDPASGAGMTLLPHVGAADADSISSVSSDSHSAGGGPGDSSIEVAKPAQRRRMLRRNPASRSRRGVRATIGGKRVGGSAKSVGRTPAPGRRAWPGVIGVPEVALSSVRALRWECGGVTPSVTPGSRWSAVRCRGWCGAVRSGAAVRWAGRAGG